MTGLLWTWAKDHASDGPAKSALAVRDLRLQAHLTRLWEVLESCVACLAEAGIEVATLKGVTAESRWYERRGERPCADVDLWLSPHQLDRAGDALRLLQPDHPWVPFFGAFAVSGRVQTVTLKRDGIEVDLHLDLFKTGLETRQPAQIWSATMSFDLPGGTVVRVLDPHTALVNLLIHLNKDRFQRLLGYADVARLISRYPVDWREIFRRAAGEGLETVVACSMEAVVADLGLEWPPDLPRPFGWQAAAWRVIWRPAIRLRGTEGRVRFRARQQLIPFLTTGGTSAAAKSVLREAFPPAQTVDIRYKDLRGPYLWKLVQGRSLAKRRAQEQLRALRGVDAGAL